MTTAHVNACLLALVVGGILAFARKGTPRHRLLGYIYVAATCGYAASSFFMYESTGQFTFFHAISIQNVVLVVGGVTFSRLLRGRVRNWPVWHLRLMLYSYLSLVVTGLRFTLPYVLPGRRIWPFLVFVVLPLCSWRWIERRVVPAWRPGRESTAPTQHAALEA